MHRLNAMMRAVSAITVVLQTASAASLGSEALYSSFYPATLNTTSWITNTSLGTYHGSVYKASTYESESNTTYGTYDYCSMPHPRNKEYQLPAPVTNGSVQAKLVYLQYIQRHQRRTSYNVIPSGEDQAYHCNNVEPFLYAGPADDRIALQPMRVFARTYTDPSNPFVESFVQGTCQLPQLTIGGLLDAYQHGKDLWSVYGDRLHFFPSSPDNSTFFRSSDSTLTQDSAGGVLRGIWPSYNRPLPLHQQASAVDTVNEEFSCNRRSEVLSAIESSNEWKAHLQVAVSLFTELSWATQNETDWTFSFNSLCDNFQARMCNGYNLPCNVHNPTQCVTQEQAEEAFRGGDWEWNYWYRTNPQARLYIQTVEGPFIAEIISRLRAVQNGTSTVKYEHDFLHDNDVGPIAGALGITALRWPAMASNIAFELWETNRQSGKGLYARVLYSGQPMPTIHGTLDWIPVSQLIDILTPYAPSDIVDICNN